MADKHYYNQGEANQGIPTPVSPTQQAGYQGGPAQSHAPQSVPYNAQSARARARGEAPVQPPAPDFSAIPEAKKTKPGVVIGIVVGCLALLAVLVAGASAFVSHSIQGISERLSNEFGMSPQQESPSELWGPNDTFNWEDIEGIEDLEDLFDYYHDFDNGDSGNMFSAPKSNDPAADDGELHDAFNPQVPYTYKEASYDYVAENEHIDAYDIDRRIGFRYIR